jgi:hypothetical protein
MRIRERATLALILGLFAVVLPAMVWLAIVRSHLRDPSVNKDQGGTFFCFTPIAVVGSAACGLPAIVLGVRGATGFGGRERWSAWRSGAVGLGALGLMVAFGTCIGPGVLAGWLR